MTNLTDLGLIDFAGTDQVRNLPAEINAVLNGLAALRWRGSASVAGASAAMAAAGTDVAGLARVTHTFDRQTRVKVTCQADVNPAGTIARYELRAAYNVGAFNLAGATAIGQPYELALDVAVARQRSGMVIADALLAAGQYTFYVLGRRAAGGAATDVLDQCMTMVEGVSLV